MAQFAIMEAYEIARQFDPEDSVTPLQLAEGTIIRTVRNMRHDMLRRQVIINFTDGSAAAVPSTSYLLVVGGQRASP